MANDLFPNLAGHDPGVGGGVKHVHGHDLSLAGQVDEVVQAVKILVDIPGPVLAVSVAGGVAAAFGNSSQQDLLTGRQKNALVIDVRLGGGRPVKRGAEYHLDDQVHG